MRLLGESSSGFSPADIEYAARKASQNALEDAVYTSGGASIQAGPSTVDYVAAISSTRTTVSADVAAEFLEDIETLARL
jgi:transitional endoplasmic reticulum ATPase